MAKSRKSVVPNHSRASRLDRLPPEVLGCILAEVCCHPSHARESVVLITSSQVERPVGLARISLTCRALYADVTPHLYRHVIIRVPFKWDCLNSLENLICQDDASVSRKLGYCRSLSIKTQQTVPYLEHHDCKYELSREDGDNSRFLLHKPSAWASNALNSLVRLLLLRLPRHTLQTFR